MISEKEVDFSKGWERIRDPQAVKRYQETIGDNDYAWYQKWVGPFENCDVRSFIPELKRMHILPHKIVFDTRGYIIIPHNVLQ